MKTIAGIWIDRTRAVVVHLVNDKEHVTHFASQLAAQHASMYNQRLLDTDREKLHAQKAEKEKNQLHKFYKKVAFSVEDAEQVFIFGPDTARLELKKEMKKTKDRYAKIRGVERAYEMTEAQIIQKVRSFQAS